MSSVIQVNRIYLIFNPVHFLVDSSYKNYKIYKTYKNLQASTSLPPGK